MVSICKPAGVICKVILETCYLTDEEKETVCRIAKEAGVDFVKRLPDSVRQEQRYMM